MGEKRSKSDGGALPLDLGPQSQQIQKLFESSLEEGIFLLLRRK